ncbi:MAG: hypothetical protein ACJ746_08950 [Bryobacteraceae bacterium]
MRSLDKQTTDLVRRLRTGLNSQLISVVLYGSAAMEDWEENTSDINVLCVVDKLSASELSQCEPIFQWWRGLGNRPPLLLTADEVRTSTDCFPMEFHDMRDHRRVLYGSDLIQDLGIDWCFYRAEVEHELRTKLIRLRQKAAELLSTPPRLLKLLADSLSTFCVLGRHALVLSGTEPKYKKAEIISALEVALNRRLEGAAQILSLRSGKEQAGIDATMLFEKYLSEMESLVRFVDALAK